VMPLNRETRRSAARTRISTKCLAGAVTVAGALVGAGAGAVDGAAGYSHRTVYYPNACAVPGHNHKGQQDYFSNSNYGKATGPCSHQSRSQGYACIDSSTSTGGLANRNYACVPESDPGGAVTANHTGYGGWRSPIVRLDAALDPVDHYMSGVSHWNTP
jgi:hypothetical protein